MELVHTNTVFHTEPRENMQDNEVDGKVTLEEAKISLGDLVSQANYAQKRFIITRYGKPAAVIAPLSAADLAKLEEVA